MSQVVDRFLQYVSFDTQSEEGAAKQPSTDKQWELARLLKQELEELIYILRMLKTILLIFGK